MARVDELRAEFEVAVKVAELEDRLVELKAAHPRCDGCGRRQGDEHPDLAAVKRELRDLRFVLRLGRQGDDESVATLAAIREVASVKPTKGK